MRKPTRFPVLTADPESAAMFSEATMAEASAAVISMDERAGLARFDRGSAPVLQLVAPKPGGHPFYVRGVFGRETRPRNPARDPLTIEAAQAVKQHYIALDTTESALTALANPFPYMEECVTWASLEYVPQRCQYEKDWQRALRITASVCEELEWAVVGFNETIGNSLDHFHVVSHHPPNGLAPYPVQQVASRIGLATPIGISHVGPHNGYPTDVWRVCLETAQATADAAAAIAACWAHLGGEDASANAAAIVEHGHVAIYVVPRYRLFTAVGWHSNLAFLEMLGVLIAGQRADFLRVKRGHWGHAHIAGVISSVRTRDADRVNAAIAELG